MTSLKRMTGTDAFLEMPEVNKGCQNGMFEECEMMEALKRGQEECGCLPWAFTSVVRQVSFRKNVTHIKGSVFLLRQ